MIVIIDNYDSFVYNILEYVSIFDRAKVLPRHKAKEVVKMGADGIIISPGPGKPDRELEFVFDLGVPVLGVCLGHQIIAEVFGGRVGKVTPRHGKTSIVTHDSKGIFKNVRNPVKVGRYHSLAILEMPDGFKVTAKSDDGVIMGIRNRDGSIEGVQFHPESVLTEDGLKMIQNFVLRCRE